MDQFAPPKNPREGSWWSQLNGYQRFVFAVATMAWMFDCLDQHLFNLARSPAMMSLLGPDQDPKFYGGLATSIFVAGWATGGMIFGALGDRFGRGKILGVCVLMYSLATGLSALSVHFIDFAIYRLITGIGVGGVFGLAVALVADTVPSKTRPRALGAMQAFSAFGNGTAAAIGITLALVAAGENHWKWLFLIGAMPAFLVAMIELRMKEPHAWVESRDRIRAEGRNAGSYKELFGHPTWRKHALLGMLLCCAGIIGLWGIGVFSNDMVGDIIGRNLEREGLSPEKVSSGKQFWMAINLLMMNVGAYIGMTIFTRMAERFGRKPTFAFFFVGALVATVLVFQFMNSKTDILWMPVVMGTFQLACFAGFSIYLPELFPTHLRATGVSFCYNVGRYLAATGPFTIGILAAKMAESAKNKALETAGGLTENVDLVTAKIDAFRNAASLMCIIFLLGIIVLPFLPETKDKPLPE